MDFTEHDTRNTSSRTFHPLQFAMITVIMVLLITLSISYLAKPQAPMPPSEAPQLVMVPPQAAVPWTIDRLRHGETLQTFFKRLNIDAGTYQTIIILPAVKNAERTFRTDRDAYFLFNAQHQLERFVYPIDTEHHLEVMRVNNQYRAEVTTIPLTPRLMTVRGSIQTSLATSLRQAGISNALANNFINAFNWDAGFARQLQRGDQFALVYNDYYANGTKVKTGPVLAAELTSPNAIYRVIGYQGSNGQINYYTPTGASLKKAFLRAPLHYKYISSPFTYHRYHPLLHIVRPHLGVDFAAPTGTPVYAASDGRIVFRGRHGGYGKVIMVQHPHGISTVYAHLSDFASQFHLGSYVKEGQTIGYVGETGLATGSHLHYEFRIGGVPHNPITVSLPTANPITQREMPSFSVYVKRMIDLMDQPQQTPTTIAKTA